MAEHLEATLDAIHHPSVITRDPRRGRWRYWRAEVGPTRWLFVVVDWHESEPTVVTAYGKRKVDIQ